MVASRNNEAMLSVRHVVQGLVAVLVSSAVVSAQPAAPQEPVLNQKGKDVQWVPTPPVLLDKMLDMAQVTPKDYLVDLGSGDGVTVIGAALRGVRSLGIEYDANLVEVSKRNAKAAGVEALAEFRRGDIFKTNFSKATVVFTFLLPSLNLQLRPTILAMKPGTRVVSNTFPMGEWEPDDRVRIDGPCERWCEALFWVVPARVGGVWRTPKGDLTLTQRFQMVSGTLGGTAVQQGRLRGEALTFTLGDGAFTGRVNGYRITGTFVENGRTSTWNLVPR